MRPVTLAQPISRILGAVSPDAITTILLSVAGVLLLAGVDDGVYVVIPAVIAATPAALRAHGSSSSGSRREG